MPLPKLHRVPRVRDDIEHLVKFVREQPYGNAIMRASEIYRAIRAILRGPELNEVTMRRKDSGIELRRYNVRQFVVVYAYFAPSVTYPNGMVSIRAVRHSRVRDVFRGVREAPLYVY